MRCIWIDADSCSREARNIVMRLTRRIDIKVVLVANHPLRIRENNRIQVVLCGVGRDAADDYIHAESRPGDIVVCRDIALTQRLLSKGAHVLNDRGKIYTEQSIAYDTLRRDMAYQVHTELGITKSHSRKKKEGHSHAFARGLEHLLYRCT